MRRLRWISVLMLLVIVAAACGGDDGGDGTLGAPEEDAPDEETDDGDAANEACEGVTLEATEVGVTADEIHITVSADTGSPLRPGLFKGSVDAVKGWAEWVNERGGVACRQVVVHEHDSFLSADEAKNGFISGCETSVAMVGTTALFANDLTEAEGCTDIDGAPSGLPDFAVLHTEPAHQCSPVSFATIPGTGECPYSGGERTFRERLGNLDFYRETEGEDMHGVWVIPIDLPSTIAASMPGFRASQELGIGLDAEFGLSGLSDQSAYTPVVQAIKENGSTYARVGLDYVGTVFLRKEAAAQGADTVRVWDCSLQCYDRRLIEEGGTAVEDQYTWIQFLPFEDEGANEALDTFLEYVDEPDGFGAQAWGAAEFFRAVVNKIIEEEGPNAVTRAKILETIPTMGEFDAGGFIAPTDIGNKEGSGCFVLLQVRDGAFVRVLPEEKGAFECESPTAFHEITLDPSTAFRG